MKRNTIVLAGLLSVGLVASTFAAVPTLIADDFESATASNYTVVDDGAPDSSFNFNFDYISAGIPLAPNSAVGDFQGLRMTANDTVGAADHLTIFNNVPITGSYVMSVDIYMGVTGTSGTTEFATIGVGGDGATFNSIFTPISGSGHFLSMTGEGGSSSDYRHFKPSVTSVPSGDPSYLNSTHTTNATGDTYQALFPSPPYQFAGSPGNAWTTLEIAVSGGLITYSLDGTPIIQDTAEETDGLVSLAYNDLFSSVAAPFQSQFVVYDNLNVVPEPASLALLALGGVALLRRRR